MYSNLVGLETGNYSLLCIALVIMFCLIWCLTSQSTAMVILGRSVHLSTFFSSASLTKGLTSTLCTYETFACFWHQHVLVRQRNSAGYCDKYQYLMNWHHCCAPGEINNQQQSTEILIQDYEHWVTIILINYHITLLVNKITTQQQLLRFVSTNHSHSIYSNNFWV